MVQKRPTGQLAVRAVEREPTAAELFDPAALERRLVEARARRAEALALRAQPADAPPPAAPSQPAPAPAPAPEPTFTLTHALTRSTRFQRV
jgi:hypothetical protein